MTRVRAADAADLHHRFDAWLRAGAAGDPPRDVALHAANCPACRRATAALDLLPLVDTGRAPLPPSRPVASPAGLRVRPRVVASVAATFVVVAAGAWVGINALTPAGIGSGTGDETPDQEVLGGVLASGSATPSPAASPLPDSPTPEATSASASPSADGASATAAPQVPPPPTHASFAAATPTPAGQATPRPTQAPTAAPTPSPATPTPVPTASPTDTPLPQCSDLIDNDGDGHIDFIGPDPDPECTSALDDDESA